MGNRKLVTGNFDVETLWRDENLCRLPLISTPAQERIIFTMDELLFLLCDEGDFLITKKAFDDSLFSYLTSLGVHFHYNLNNVVEFDARLKNENIFDLFSQNLTDMNFTTKIEDNMSLSMFGVQDQAKNWCNHNKIIYDYPAMSTIKKVNSKLYSYNLRLLTNTEIGSKVVYNSDELIRESLLLLELSKSIIIKDMFGVSGKGNILINSETMLKSIIGYVQKQEKEGKKLEFIIEPYLAKKNDFTCIAHIRPSGKFEILDIQYMISNGFAYAGTCSLTDELKKIIHNNNYLYIAEQVCKTLYQDGYYGDVCIDSMVLENNTVLPIVEVNARKSMTTLKHNLDNYLCKHKLECKFTYANMSLSDELTMDRFIEILQNNDLLFTLNSRVGVMPLSANTLNLNNKAESNKGAVKGRFYYAIIGNTREIIDEMSGKFDVFIKAIH